MHLPLIIHAGVPIRINILSVGTTTATFSWSRPRNANTYKISLNRIRGKHQILCPDVRDDRIISINTNSHAFTKLEEFSVYMFKVTATITKRRVTYDTGTTTITTRGTTPTGIPHIVSQTIKARRITLYLEIDCIERNGIIINYEVELEKQSGDAVHVVIEGHRLTATGLTPATSYIIQVAGINANGVGPTNTKAIVTDEDSKLLFFVKEC